MDAYVDAMSQEKLDERVMNRIISKAAWLMQEGRVVKMSDYMYYVIGRKNRHIVRVSGEQLVCTCEGFKERGVCSHIVAVSTIIKLGGGREYLDELMRIRVERELRLLGKGPIR